MRRLVIIVATVALFAAGFLLWRMTQDMSSDAEAKTSKKSDKVEAAPVAAAPAESSGVVKRDARIPVAAGPQARTPTRPTASGGGGGPALEAGSGSAAPEVTPVRALEIELKRQIVKQLDAIDGPVSDCVGKHGKGKPSGAAALLVKIEKQKNGDAAVVEVGVEPIDTTVKNNQPLLDCLASTGKRISIDLPDPVTEVTLTHQVNLDAGAVTGHDLTAYDFKPWGRFGAQTPPPAKP